jgi:prepilin-type processing-associated H-X9-DG protein
MSQIRKTSEMVFLFDGISINLQTQNANRLNARHNKQRDTNILFFDGHAETLPTKSLPGGDGNAGVGGSAASATFALTNLANYKYPLWRLDQ